MVLLHFCDVCSVESKTMPHVGVQVKQNKLVFQSQTKHMFRGEKYLCINKCHWFQSIFELCSSQNDQNIIPGKETEEKIELKRPN